MVLGATTQQTTKKGPLNAVLVGVTSRWLCVSVSTRSSVYVCICDEGSTIRRQVRALNATAP